MGRARRSGLALVAAGAALAVLGACGSLKDALAPPDMVKIAPESTTSLIPPRAVMTGGKGGADAPYPNDFGATVKPDGTLAFPQHTPGKLRGATLLVEGQPVVTMAEDGTVKGPGLKRVYKFAEDGALLDDEGHGVRIGPDGSVRAIGGPWRYQPVFAWTADGGGAWDKVGWRTLEIVALVIVENMLPSAIRAVDGGAPKGGDAGASKGLYIPPPSEWFK